MKFLLGKGKQANHCNFSNEFGLCGYFNARSTDMGRHKNLHGLNNNSLSNCKNSNCSNKINAFRWSTTIQKCDHCNEVENQNKFEKENQKNQKNRKFRDNTRKLICQECGVIFTQPQYYNTESPYQNHIKKHKEVKDFFNRYIESNGGLSSVVSI